MINFILKKVLKVIYYNCKKRLFMLLYIKIIFYGDRCFMLVYGVEGERSAASLVKDSKAYIEIAKFVEAYTTIIQNPNEFLDDNDEYDASKFNEYRLSMLKGAKDTVKYTLNLGLTKIDKEWTLDRLSSTDLDKINGTYRY